MENYSYATAYPESGESSPRSRETDFENPPPWEEQPPSSNNYKVKFMCSYGGKIHPRPNDNQLSYFNGETKILVVDRNIKFSGLIAKLSALSDADVCFKYQLPGEDLDALISVTNDDDLDNMMHEYDRLCRASKPARLRLFLFTTSTPAVEASRSFGSGEERTDREKFVDALNSGPIQSPPPPSTADPPNNVDFLFGLDKGVAQPPPVASIVQNPIPEPEIPFPTSEDRVVGADPIQMMQIQELQRLQIGGCQEQAVYRRRSDDNLVGGFTGDYYVQNFTENAPPATMPAAVSSHAGYWPERHVAGGMYQPSAPGPDQSVYMIQTPTGVYHAPMGRSVTGPTGQGYYAVQRMPPDVYRDQPPMYNVVSSMPAPPAPPATTVGQPPQGQFGMLSPATAGGVAIAYDSGMGRQVYYNAPPYQAMGDMRPAGALNQEGKVVAKAS